MNLVWRIRRWCYWCNTGITWSLFPAPLRGHLPPSALIELILELIRSNHPGNSVHPAWHDKNINSSSITCSWAKSLDWIKNKTKNFMSPSGGLEGRNINMRVEGDVILLQGQHNENKRGFNRDPWWMTAQFSGQIQCFMVCLKLWSMDAIKPAPGSSEGVGAGWFTLGGFSPYWDFGGCSKRHSD